MKNKLKNFGLCYICLISFSINAERFGDPGEIIAIKASSDDIDKYLTVEINESHYKLIPLPFEKQNESIYVDDVKININQKDFGESRITIENNSMVNLSKEDSDRAFKESKIIQKALNNYSKFLVPDLNFMNPVEGIISSRYGKKRYINNQPRILLQPREQKL